MQVHEGTATRIAVSVIHENEWSVLCPCVKNPGHISRYRLRRRLTGPQSVHRLLTVILEFNNAHGVMDCVARLKNTEVK